MSASTPLLSLKGITKIFPGVRALENVQLDLWPGKVTALIGENGAGKSTLVKVMTGIYQPEEGEILYKAIPIHLPTPESAHKVGITAIHQETVLFDELSVSENIFVGQYLYKGLLKTLDWLSDAPQSQRDPHPAGSPDRPASHAENPQHRPASHGGDCPGAGFRRPGGDPR